MTKQFLACIGFMLLPMLVIAQNDTISLSIPGNDQFCTISMSSCGIVSPPPGTASILVQNNSTNTTATNVQIDPASLAALGVGVDSSNCASIAPNGTCTINLIVTAGEANIGTFPLVIQGSNTAALTFNLRLLTCS